MSRSAKRKSNENRSVRGKKAPSTPVWLVCAFFFVLALVGIVAGVFALLITDFPPDGTMIRFLIWCAAETAVCVASGVLFAKEALRRRWFSFAAYALSVVSAARVLIPGILMAADVFRL